MDEKEKMLNGLLYDANYDENLKTERIKCKMLCQKYNNAAYDNFDEKQNIIKELLGKTKKKFSD